jgi:hypothetical protein
MDAARFNCLTRRLVLGGFAAGALGRLLGRDAARALSRRRRCRKKKRTFCAGRCCPKKQRCMNRQCVLTCAALLRCDPPGGAGNCSADVDCFCTRTPSGRAACGKVGSGPVTCNNLAACDQDTPCPRGKICATCACSQGQPDFRCLTPCPPG